MLRTAFVVLACDREKSSGGVQDAEARVQAEATHQRPQWRTSAGAVQDPWSAGPMAVPAVQKCRLDQQGSASQPYAVL